MQQPVEHTPSTAPQQGAPPVTALTPREREVAVLVAEGLSNAEIAQRLVLTPGTVANHVAHMTRALRMKNRVRVAVWAVQQGLYPSQRPTGAMIDLAPYRSGRAEDIATDAG